MKTIIKPEPKQFCRCCRAALPNPSEHRAPILVPISLEDAFQFVKGINRGTIMITAVCRNRDRIIANNLSTAEVYEDIFGNLPFMEREVLLTDINYLLHISMCRLDKAGRWVEAVQP